MLAVRSVPVPAASIAVAIAWLALSGPAAPLAAQDSPPAPVPETATVLSQLDSPALDLAQSRHVASIKLAIDLADVWIDDGWLVPAPPIAGRPIATVFVGSGRIVLVPPDEIEAGQLELFTGQRRLDRTFERAVFVVASDAATERLLLPEPKTPPPDVAKRADEIWQRWRGSAEHRYLGVDTGVLADALHDPGAANFFFGWIEQPDDHPFFVMVDPPSFEQVTVGQFVPEELDDKELRRTLREIRREQRRGRLLGIDAGDLGTFDQWLSATMGSRGGSRTAARAAFEPERYVLEATISGSGDLQLEGRARIMLTPVFAGSRVVRATLHSDLELTAVKDAVSDASLPFLRRGASVAIVLPSPAAAGQTVAVELDYRGHFLDKVTRSVYVLRDSLAWYPHVGDDDRATYDSTLRWPKKLELFAAGQLTGSGEKDGVRWERRLVEIPTIGTSFEIGQYEIEKTQAGHVAIEVAFDALSDDLPKKSREEIVGTLRDSLLFFEETFGPYPLDTLRAVTVPRGFSQGLLGFVTLSALGVADADGFLRYFFDLEDRRTHIAHEVSHQWWGNQVAQQSYRDVWLSEAMAEYSAILFAREKLVGKERVRFGPTRGWKDDLLSTTADGRTVESIGPIVLGARLSSSKYSAYQEIVYTKGAIVLDMLARHWNPDSFPKVLKEIVRVSHGRMLSTADAVSLFSRIAGTDLEPFARQYIYGTGLPEVDYDWSLETKPDGAHTVKVRAEQRASYHFRYRVARGAAGRLEIAREAVPELDAETSALVVPFQVRVELSDAEYEKLATEQKGRFEESKRKKGEAREGTATGNLAFRGKRLELEIPVSQRPTDFWLDREEAVFGSFFDARRRPKRALFRKGTDALARGEREEADRLLRQGLSAETRVVVGEDEKPDAGTIRDEGRWVDARIHLALAENAIRAGDAAAAARERDEARRMLDKADERILETDFLMTGARIDLATGKTDQAFRALRKSVLKRSSVDETEAWLLFALTALDAGELDDCREAIDVVRDREVDVAPLVEALREARDADARR